MDKLAKAVIKVMESVKGMEKNSRVGQGHNGYDGTKYSDVAEVFNKAMSDNGLVLLPIGIDEETKIDRWEEANEWQGKTTMKQKQSVFTKVKTKYLLLHTSGESQELAGYGHGVDPQDKGAGKATTYALKNLLLYTFLTPVGKIDDTDLTHSKEMEVVQPVPVPKKVEIKVEWLTQAQLKKALKSNLKQLQAVLKIYDNTSTHNMKADFKAQLQEYEKELIFNDEIKQEQTTK